MTKKYTIINLNGFMYVVDTEINPLFQDHSGTWLHIPTSRIFTDISDYVRMLTVTGFVKIISSNDSSLGLPLLPAVEENVQQLAEKVFKTREDRKPNKHGNDGWYIDGWIDGYRAASSKQYTEEDVNKAYEFGLCYSKGTIANAQKYTLEKLMQSLKPTPVTVELEMEFDYDPSDYNSNPQKLLPSVYKPAVDENNKVAVNNWIY